MTAKDIEIFRTLIRTEVSDVIDVLRIELDGKFSEINKNFDFLFAQNEKREQEHLATQAQLKRIDQRFDGIEVRLDGIETRLDVIEVRLDGIDVRLDAIDVRLDNMGLQMSDMRSTLKTANERLDSHDEDISQLKLAVASRN